MREEDSLRPWAQNVKNTVVAIVQGIIIVGALAGLYLLLINARLLADALQAPGLLGPGYISIGAVLVAFYLFVRNFSRHKFSVDGFTWTIVALFTVNLLWPGLIADVMTFILQAGVVLGLATREQIHGLAYDHSKRGTARY